MSLEGMLNGQGKALIVANGELEEKFLKAVAPRYDVIVCADGAANRLRALDIIPDILVGDFDSIRQETRDYFCDQSVEMITLSPEKDFSDTHVSIELIMERGWDQIDIIGGLGGRWDHSVANLSLLYFGVRKKCKLRLISQCNLAEIYEKGEHNLQASPRHYWSCFAIFEDAVVSIQGMKYPLSHKKIRRGESIGLSNEFLTEDGRLIVEEGSVVVVRSQKD